MLQLYNDDLNMTNCIIMKTEHCDTTSVFKIHQSSLCQYLQESYINIFHVPDTMRHDSFAIIFIQLFKLPHLNILHVDIPYLSIHQPEEHIHMELLLQMEKELSTNHTIKEFLIDLSRLPFNSLINSLLTGVERNDTIQFFSVSSESTQTMSLKIDELLKNC